MADVFISYSRHDKDFVERLRDALNAAGEETWVDWAGIAPTAEWKQEIYRGIESAHNFLFVLSPDSVHSTVCEQEIARAAELGKRMVPVMRRTVPDDEVSEQLARYNYVFFREEDDFDAAVQRLVDALHTDLEWTQGHTRLLVRSREWQAHGRDASFLLRGSDLTDAEQWLANSAGKQTEPNPLQAEYIVSSRRAAVKRQRSLLTAAVVALLGVLVLAGVALHQRNDAQAMLQIATSSSLGSAALQEADRQYDLAVLLSLTALQVNNTFEGRNASLTLSRGHRNLVAYLHHAASTTPGQTLAFSPDGRYLASARGLGLFELWDTASHRMVWSATLPGACAVAQVAIAPDDAAFAVGSSCGVTLLRHAPLADAPLQMTTLPEAQRAPRKLEFSPDGRELTVLGAAGLQGWNLRGAHPEREAAGPAADVPVRGTAFSYLPGSPARLLVAEDGFLLVREGSHELRRIALPGPAGRTGTLLRPDSSGMLAVVGYADGGSDLVELAQGRVRPVGLATTPTSELPVRLSDVAIDRAAGEVLLASEHAEVSVWRIEPDGDHAALPLDRKFYAGGATEHLRASAPRQNVVFSGDGHQVVVSESIEAARHFLGDDDMLLWTTARESGTLLPVPRAGAPVARLVYSPDAQWIATAARDGLVRLWSATEHRLVAEPWPATHRGDTSSAAPAVNGLAFAPGGHILLSTTAAGSGPTTLRLWDVDARRPLPAVSLPGAEAEPFLSALAVSSQGVAAVAGASGRVWLWGLTTHSVQCTLPAPAGVAPEVAAGAIRSLSFSADGTMLAAGGVLPSSVLTWNVATCAPLVWQGSGRDAEIEVERLGFNPAGTELAAAGPDGVFVWDTETGRRLDISGEFDNELITGLSFSPGGQLLALRVAENNEVVLWDLAMQQTIGVAAETTPVPLAGGLGFSPDDRNLAAGLADGSVWLMENRLKSWPERACRVANRNLSKAEWTHALGKVPYRRTCPQFPDGEGVSQGPSSWLSWFRGY